MADNVLTRLTMVLVLVSLVSCGGGMAARPEAPALFPSKPPAPTAMLDSDALPLDAVAPKATTIGEAAKAIKAELVRQDIEGTRICGVHDDSNGFVLVTPPRKIDESGTCLERADSILSFEWIRGVPSYIKRVVVPDEPRWSLIVFIVTSHKVETMREEHSMDDVEEKLYDQCSVQASASFLSRPLDRSAGLTTMFYEFVQERSDKDAELVPQLKGWSAKKHLRIAGLFQKSCSTDAPAAWCETD